jgi:exopolysaccharide biosynthesis WecB/TagA/CpsF family protein
MTQISRPALAHIDGWGINTPNLDVAIRSAIAEAGAAKAFTLFTLNLDHLAKLKDNEKFREAYRNADLVTADGAPVAWLARWQDPNIERATGADMLMPLLNAASDARLPVFLFGSSADVLTTAARELGDHTDGLLDIVGTLAPSQFFDPEGPEADLAIATMAKSGARLCFVALGAPKQEIFAERARASGLTCGMICVGAAVDFLAGAQIRAPLILRKTGLEWIWRLATNPRRFTKRYTECAIVFGEILLAPLRERFARARLRTP